MDFNQLMARRWSCREFMSEPVADEVLEQIFSTAQRTASWCNTQPWQVHLLGGDALERFAEELSSHVKSGAAPAPDFDMPAQYWGVYAERRRQAGYALYESLGIERSDHASRAAQMHRNFTFFGAPHAAIVTSDRAQGTYGAVDCGGYVANLMNAALDLGIASIAQAAIAAYSDKVRALLELPEHRVVVCGVALGHPASERPVNQFRTSRADLVELVIPAGRS